MAAFALPLIGALGGSGLNFLGGLLGNKAQNKSREELLAMQKEALAYLKSQGIQNPEAVLEQAMGPLLQYSNSLLDQAPDYQQNLLNMIAQQLGNYSSESIPKFAMPSDMMAYYNSPMADLGRSMDDIRGNQTSTLFNLPQNSSYNAIFDRMGGMMNGQDQALAALLDRGNNLVDQFGTTAYNLNAQDNAGGAMSRNGFNNQSQGLYDAGNALFGAGGYTGNLQGMSDTALQALQRSAGGAGPYSQANMLGESGQAAMQGLLSPMSRQGIGGGMDPGTLQALLGQATQSGYTPQNSAYGAQGYQGLQDLLARNGQIDDVIASGQQAFGGGLPGGDPYAGMLDSIIGQLTSGAGASFGGGGATGASAGSMGAMDPQLAAMLAKGKDFFSKDPLLSMEEMISMARDQAGTAAAQRAEAAQRFARSRGGGGAIVNSGTQNQAMVDFADQALQAEAAAMRDAALKRQELGLSQQMQGGQIGIAAANADTNRQQVAASRDIASANNATSASIANAQTQLQAALQSAQLRNAGLQAAANAAVAARGQNYGQSQAGLQAMLEAQNLANQRGSIFNDATKNALNDATSRYGINMNALSPILGAQTQQQATNANFINNWNQNQNTAYNDALQGSLAASTGAGGLNTQLAQLMAQYGLGAEQQATSRLGLGMDAMNNAGNQANQALSTWGQIGNQASADQLARMGLGANMLNSNVQGRQNAANLLGSTVNSMYNNINNAGQALNQTNQTQGQLWQNMWNNDYNNRVLGSNSYNDYFKNVLGLGGLANQTYQQALTPLEQLMQSIIGYSSGANQGYAGLAGNMSRNIPQQQNPWPQLNISPSQFSGFGSPATPPFVQNQPYNPNYSTAWGGGS